MAEEVDEYLLDLAVLGEGEALNKVLDPDFGVVFDVLPDELIEVLPDDEALVADAVDDAGHQHHVVLLLLAVLGVEDHLHDLLGYAEQLDALVD